MMWSRRDTQQLQTIMNRDDELEAFTAMGEYERMLYLEDKLSSLKRLLDRWFRDKAAEEAKAKRLHRADEQLAAVKKILDGWVSAKGKAAELDPVRPPGRTERLRR